MVGRLKPSCVAYRPSRVVLANDKVECWSSRAVNIDIDAGRVMAEEWAEHDRWTVLSMSVNERALALARPRHGRVVRGFVIGHAEPVALDEREVDVKGGQANPPTIGGHRRLARYLLVSNGQWRWEFERANDLGRLRKSLKRGSLGRPLGREDNRPEQNGTRDGNQC